jgi:GTP-binding protein
MKQYQKAHFLKSVATLEQLPPDQGIEVAFVGRSNAGKSSVLNELTHNKNLARVSKTPGRTQLLNFFTLDETRRLVDLPGYGFARVPNEVRERWVETLDGYFQSRDCLKGLILVMDIRHPLQELDLSIIDASKQAGLPTHILLNKADKLSKNELRKTEAVVKKALDPFGESISYQVFSALKGTGVKELQAVLNSWFNF